VGQRSLSVLVYRVFPYLPAARPGRPGHPLYEHHPQRAGRVDHPDYYVWYVTRQPEAAIGETFGDLAVWEPSMFDFPLLPGAHRALGVYVLPDDLRLLDLDDPRVLLDRSLRPTQVVTRNLAVTQAWGHAVWAETDPHDRAQRKWQAVGWWSYHHPTWSVLASWERPRFDHAEPLDLTHPAVTESARVLLRLLP